MPFCCSETGVVFRIALWSKKYGFDSRNSPTIDIEKNVVFCEIGLVGLGRMSEAFATNLIADGLKLKVFDRNKKSCDSVPSRGADALRALSGLARAEIVLTSLPDDEALSDVVERSGGLLEALLRGAIHVSMSTVSPSVARRRSRQHAARGHCFVAVPVLRYTNSARDRKLYRLISGDVSSMPGVLGLRSLQRLGRDG